uniref:Uncharacterized protein n=1 Tax=Arundo donax TaxID=35708 RepID=A0A0A9BNH4_ARUDO
MSGKISLTTNLLETKLLFLLYWWINL